MIILKRRISYSLPLSHSAYLWEKGWSFGAIDLQHFSFY
jgi:hypothetical protein